MFARRQAPESIGKLGAAGRVLAFGRTARGSQSRRAIAGEASRSRSAALADDAVKDIRPGMVGYGLTVFSGTKPERFPVRVVGVLPKHTSLMDIILVESDDPRLKHSGIVAGMSGSPIYFDGKLAGHCRWAGRFPKTRSVA